MFVAAFSKEILQNCRALVLQNAGCNIAPVIQCRHLQKVHYTSGRSGRRICATENQTTDPRVHERTRAHRAGLLGHIKIAIGQQFHLIMRAPDDFAFANNNRTDGYFAGLERFLRLP